MKHGLPLLLAAPLLGLLVGGASLPREAPPGARGVPGGQGVSAPPGPAASPLAIERALGQLREGDWILKWEAMQQLSRWKAREAAPPIKAILAGDGNPWLRGRALVALAGLLGAEVLPDALRFSKEATPELRAAAAEALGIIAAPQSDATVAGLLMDPAPGVRYQAVIAVARLRREQGWEAVAPRLDARDPEMVRHAIRALVTIATPASRERMIELLDHENRDVRAEAARTLGEAGARDAIATLLTRMAVDPDATVRVACEKALVSFEPEALAEPCLAALRGDKRDFYRPALQVLAQRPTLAVCDQAAALIKEPADTYKDFLGDFFHLLTRLDPDRYHEAVARYLDSDRADVRRRAIEGLALCQKTDLYPLLRPALGDKDQSIRNAAFQAIRKAAAGAPKEGIVAYLADPLRSTDTQTRRIALEMVREQITPAELASGIAALEPLLGGSDAKDRELAAKALERVGDDDGKRRIAAAQGYITEWRLVGPFPNNPEHRAVAVPFFPEREIDFEKTYDAHAFGYGAAFRVADAPCGGQTRKCLYIYPPWERNVSGRTLAAFPLDLPQRDGLKLVMALGLQDSPANSDGVRFEVTIDKARVFEKEVVKPTAWEPAEVDLAPYAGKKIVLALAVDPLKTTTDDRALVAEPRVVAGEETVADLLELAPSAVLTIDVPEQRSPMAWEPCRVSSIDGIVALYDIFPLPIHYKAAYGVADIDSPQDQPVQLWVKWEDDAVLWLGGAKILEQRGKREQKIDATLTKGRNRFLIKVCNERDAWLFRIRVTDKDGKRVDGLKPAPLK